MTLDELMQKFDGKWDNGAAVIRDQGGYFWRVAEGAADKFTLTREGLRFGLQDTKPAARVERKKQRVADADDIDL